MRRLILATGLALGLTLTPSAAAQAPTQDSVTGKAFVVLPLTPTLTIGVDLDIHALSGPAGQHPTGSVNWTFGNEPVTCLSVRGNKAVIGIPGVETGIPGLFYITDRDDSLGVDTVGFVATSSTPTTCPTPGGHEDAAIFRGDIVVKDDQRPFRMVGKGSVFGGVPASYAFILPCDAAKDSDAVLELRTAGNRFRLTSLDAVACSDNPAVPPTGFDTMTGNGTGTFNSAPGWRLAWTLVDGGAGGAGDSVHLRLTNPSGAQVLNGSAAPPGKFPGASQPTGSNTAQMLP